MPCPRGESGAKGSLPDLGNDREGRPSVLHGEIEVVSLTQALTP